MNSKEKEEYRRALEHVRELYPAAHVLAKAQMVIRHENLKIRIDELTDLLKQDASISADVIRASNSAHYGFATPSADLQTSINRIGLDELLKLVGHVIARNVYSKDLDHYAISAADYWSEGVACAIMMEWISSHAGLNAQEGYTVGLLSSVGKTVINEAFGMFGDEYCYDGNGSVRDWELGLLGFDHAHAASVLLKRWDFPVDIIAPIKYQYQSEKDPENSYFTGALEFVREWFGHAGPGLSCVDYEFSKKACAYMSSISLSEEVCLEGQKSLCDKLNDVKAM